MDGTVARRRWARLSAIAALLALGAAEAARAQVATASIEGVVEGSDGTPLPGVAVTVVHAATGGSRAVASADNGLFRAALLPVGSYELTATLPGFQTLVRGVSVTVGQALWLELRMRPVGIAETVVVEGRRSGLDRGRYSASSTVSEGEIARLPVNGRNFVDFVLLTPGVTRDRNGELSFAGQRNTLNSVVVDGADNNHTFFGRSLGAGRAPYQFSLETVKEFQVNSNAFSAEFGRLGAGLVNVVTQSGANRPRGSAFAYYRDAALNAVDAISRQNSQPKLPYNYRQFGATIGGPLRANRDFFFLAYDGQRSRIPQPVVLSLPQNTPADAATATAVEMLRTLASSWSRALDQDVVLVKTDHALAQPHRLSLRYNHQNFAGEGYENFGPQQAYEHSGDSLVRTRSMTASWTGVFGGRAFTEMRIHVARDHQPGTANSDNPEADIRQSGTRVLVIGRNNFSPRENSVERLQLADSLTWTHGRHLLKTGVDAQFDRIVNYFPGFFGGSYTFNSLAAFARGRPDGPGESYRQSFPGPRTSGAETRPDLREYSIFTQDDWKPRSDVSLGLGFRYDRMVTDGSGVRNPDPALVAAGIDTGRFPVDGDNFGPRLGLAWSPRNRPFVVRAGWGLFYGRTPMIMASAAGSNNGLNTVSLIFTGQDVPTYPQKFAGLPAAGVSAVPSIVYVEDDFANPRLSHSNVAVEWEPDRGTTLALTYLHVSGADLPRSTDRNIGTLGTRTLVMGATREAVTVPFFGPDRPFGRFNRVVAFESIAESHYDGITLELRRRVSDGAQFRLAYTAGKVVDTVPDATAVLPGNPGDDAKYASDPLDFEVDRTAGNNDQRHRVVASGVYATDGVAAGIEGIGRALWGGWWFSAVLVAQSGQPFSARVSGDLNGDGNPANDLVPGTRRNQHRLPSMVALDARIARDLPLGRTRAQLVVEAFNLFNRDNIVAVRPVQYALSGQALTPTADFRRAAATAGERIMQLAFRISF